MIKHDYLQDLEKKQDAIRHLAAYYRRAADRLRLVKPIIVKFNGKVSKAERLIIFSDNKKIQAGKMISLLNDKRAALLQMAAEYDRFAEELPETMRHIQDTANVLNSVLYTIPWHLSGLIGVDRIRV